MTASPDSRTETKVQLRDRMRKVRAAVTAADHGVWSAAIAERVIQHPTYRSARVLCLYVDVRGEVGTGALRDHALTHGKRVLLPRVERDGSLSLRPVARGETLVRSALGVWEPPDHAPVIEPEAVDVFIVPGLSFDPAGGRLGYGRGYYDRLLGRADPRCAFLGLAFECQLVAAVPREPHDVRVHHVVTEARWLG